MATALITGGTRGIGLGIAEALADEGFDLALCGRRPASSVADVMSALEARGVRVTYTQADISDGEGRQRLVDGVREKHGELHVLVNNAG
ncbi:MAG: SDR family NAD(P)-dependent oxidoreductase, partial [Bacteroidota bacterium]